MHGFVKILSFFLASGFTKLTCNPIKSKENTFSADPI
jgi:hypothetical protein